VRIEILTAINISRLEYYLMAFIS